MEIDAAAMPERTFEQLYSRAARDSGCADWSMGGRRPNKKAWPDSSEAIQFAPGGLQVPSLGIAARSETGAAIPRISLFPKADNRRGW